MQSQLAVVDAEPKGVAMAGLFATGDPGALSAAQAYVKPLADLVHSRNLAVDIGGRQHLKIEALQALAVMLGLYSSIEWTRSLPAGGWEARCVVRNSAGNIVGSGEAMCSRDESLWRDRDEFALRAMAQTRATGRALRGLLGFVMVLAGYEPCGAEEMPTHPTTTGNGSEARDHSAPDTPADVVCPMGRNRGQPLGQMSSDDLVSMIDYLGDKVDDPKWGSKNKSLSDSAKAVLADRGEPFCPPTTF